MDRNNIIELFRELMNSYFDEFHSEDPKVRASASSKIFALSQCLDYLLMNV